MRLGENPRHTVVKSPRHPKGMVKMTKHETNGANNAKKKGSIRKGLKVVEVAILVAVLIAVAVLYLANIT